MADSPQQPSARRRRQGLVAASYATLLAAGCHGDSIDRDGVVEPVVPRECAPLPSFSDITSSSPDLARFPYGGEAGWDHADKYGPGVALVDFDGDGYLDLAQVRSERNDSSLRSPVVFRGLGDGRFEVAAEPAWSAQNGVGVLAFDYDSDDDLDLLFAVDDGDSRLFRNDGAFSFVDVTAEAGLEGIADHVYTAGAGDVDGDGDLDLYLGQWRASEPEHGRGLAANLLLINDGGAFELSDQDVACDGSATLGQALADIDLDGDLDIYVANDFFTDCLYTNDGAGRFTEVGAEAGIRDAAMHGMGVAIGDLSRDGALDILVTDTDQEDVAIGNAVFVRDVTSLRFDERARALGLDGLTTLSADWLVSWGVGIEDFDGDGCLDVHIATHGLREELFYSGTTIGFEPAWSVMNELGDVDGRGTAYGDVDGDGDLDIVVARRGDSLQILRNEANPTTTRVEIVPTRLAIGATVSASGPGERQIRVIQAGSSYLSTSPPYATFGADEDAPFEMIQVRTPDGWTTTVEHVGPGVVNIDRN